MVVTELFAKFRAATALAVAGSFLIAAHPAMANSSAAADIAAPLRAAQAAGQSVSGAEDEQFRQLFSSWQNYEETGLAVSKAKPTVGAAGIASVSIPSRNPLQAEVMTSGFGMREHPVLGGRRAHTGVDLAAPVGTPVYATADGVVSKAAWFGGYGLFISLEHGGALQTRYGHMSRLNVAEGQTVRKGEVIGYVGSTGRSTGPHLHYEVRVDGTAVNPVPYMSQQGQRMAEVTERDGRGG